MNLPVVELAEIRLAPGRSEADLIAASSRFQDHFLNQQPGFLRRELLRGAEGTWFDLVLWRDHAASAAIMDKVMTSPECLAYFAVMQMDEADPAAGVRHMEVLARYG